MTKRENDAIWTAAEKANRQCGQWMPQRWIEIFIKELASSPPATPAGVGANEIARLVEDLKDASESLHHPPSIQSQRNIKAMNAMDRAAKIILALLSRAGDQR